VTAFDLHGMDGADSVVLGVAAWYGVLATP
jgi:hypothetical protein